MLLPEVMKVAEGAERRLASGEAAPTRPGVKSLGSPARRSGSAERREEVVQKELLF